jgi:site-specific DNA-methyltransferase (adenine-specific)
MDDSNGFLKGSGYFRDFNQPSFNGSFSRYFDLDIWFDNLPESVEKTYPFILVPKASKSEKNKGCEELKEKPVDYEGRRGQFNSKHRDDPRSKEGYANNKETIFKNHHPTVKPLKLFTYLITIFSRPGQTILDPYAGSGTTCIAAKILNRNYIGFELETEYKTIADARLKAHEPEPQKPLTAF